MREKGFGNDDDNDDDDDDDDNDDNDHDHDKGICLTPRVDLTKVLDPSCTRIAPQYLDDHLQPGAIP